MMIFKKIATGRRGEGLAISHLRNQGYKIVEKNYKTRLGEIDIIGKDGDCMAFIEVRTRNTGGFGLPEDSIDRRKQNQIAKAALLYIKRFDLVDKACRFDVVCIEDADSSSPKIRLIKDAFELDSRYRY